MSKKNDILDALLYASASEAGKNELWEYENADPSLKLSDSAKNRLIRRLEREEKYRAIHKTYRPLHEFAKRAAAVVLVVMMVGFVGVISVEAVRVSIWETVVEWYEDNIRIRYEKDDAASPLSEILDYKEPDPGSEYTRFELSRSTNRYSLEYECGDRLISYQQYLISNHAGKMSDGYDNVRDITVNGSPGILACASSEHSDVTMITWNDGVYLYRISGSIPAEELIAIAETVE